MIPESDGYSLSAASQEDAAELFSLMRSVYDALDDKSIFAVGDLCEEWVRERLTPPCFGIAARAPEGGLAGMLLVCRGDMGEGLGRDIGLPESSLPSVWEMDTAAVDPLHRGHRLEKRMLLYAETQLPGDARLLMCTVSPDNPASLWSLQSVGYRIAATKEKYGGFLRHILVKELPS